MTVLSVRGIGKSYGGVRALRALSFDVSAGEVVAMIGPNGAGKTTCFDILGGQLRPDRGTVALEGRPVTALAPHRLWRLGVGRTFQVATTFGSMTVRENVQVALLSFARRLWSMRPSSVRAQARPADALLARVGISALADRACGELAYGDLKRVDLALALANQPRLLLMDEPTAGMALEERGELMRLVTRLARDDGVALLFTEHDMDIVFGHADRVLVLAGGESIAEGPPALIRDDARVRALYLGEVDA
ncbi:MAG: ABC transporter ATP-binding protein [Burkholderiales bacterium]